MKFQELSKKWKFVVISLIIINVLLVEAFVAFNIFLHDYRASNAAERAKTQKADAELIGERFQVSRDGKDSVDVNLYFPEQYEGKLPLLVNFHGGGFVLGDADETDSQCAAWANAWNMIVVSVNYTAPDMKSVKYGIQEGIDTIRFFMEHAKEYSIDTNSIFVSGHSAGGYYAAMTAIEADKLGITLKGQILMCPWATALPSKVNDTLAPALFILGGADEISQRSSKYQNTLINCGINITVKEYVNGQHPFIHTIYPELEAGLSESDREIYITEEQKQLARDAENDIKEWLLSLK